VVARNRCKVCVRSRLHKGIPSRDQIHLCQGRFSQKNLAVAPTATAFFARPYRQLPLRSGKLMPGYAQHIAATTK